MSDGGGAGVVERRAGAGERGPLAHGGHLLVGPLVVAAHGVGDVGEVAHPLGRHDGGGPGRHPAVDRGERRLADRQPALGEQVAQVVVERGHAVVVEGRGAGAEDRHVLPGDAERLAVADQLPGHVAAGVLGAAALELVDRHDVGEVQHVDLLELGRGAELRRHHVQRGVDERHDGRVALPDAGRLDDHQVVAGRLAAAITSVRPLGHLGDRAAGGHRAEEHLLAVPTGHARDPAEGVHPDPVAEQRAAAAPAGRVDREHGDAQLVLLVEAEPADELVGERGLAGAAGAGDAEDRAPAGGRPPRGCCSRVALVQLAGLDLGDQPGERVVLAGVERVERRRGPLGQVGVAGLDHRVDHPGEAQLLAVLRGEDARDAARVQQVDLLADDDAAPAAEDLDVAGAVLGEELDQVAEVLDVPALVGADGDALDVLLDGGADDLADRAVVAEVDHLGTLRLQDAAHDVDRRVVPVEQARRGDEPDGVHGAVQRWGVGHKNSLMSYYSDVQPDVAQNLAGRSRAQRPDLR